MLAWLSGLWLPVARPSLPCVRVFLLIIFRAIDSKGRYDVNLCQAFSSLPSLHLLVSSLPRVQICRPLGLPSLYEKVPLFIPKVESPSLPLSRPRSPHRTSRDCPCGRERGRGSPFPRRRRGRGRGNIRAKHGCQRVCLFLSGDIRDGPPAHSIYIWNFLIKMPLV